MVRKTMSSTGNKVTLQSNDGEIFEVEEAVAAKSVSLKNLIEDVGTENAIPVSNVTGKILAKVIEYCRKHADAGDRSVDDELKAWDADFMDVDQATLFDLTMAANYLNIPELSDLTCQTIADMFIGKSPEELRSLFSIKNDLTPEEEAAIRRQNAWAFK